MLLDTRTMKAIEAKEEESTREDFDYTPSDYERDKDVFVFRMTWDGEDEGDLMTFPEASDFILNYLCEGEEWIEEDVNKLLDAGHAVRIGPDEDWYSFSPLGTPMKHNFQGELVEVDEPFFEEFEPPFDCVAGVDFPGSF